MKTARNLIAIAAAATLLAGCQSGSLWGPRETVRDGLASAELSRALGYADRARALRTEFRALEYGATGAPVTWSGRSGRRGNVIPGPVYKVNTFDCRDYTHTVFVDGEAVVAKGTACRQADGSWRLVT